LMMVDVVAKSYENEETAAKNANTAISDQARRAMRFIFLRLF
jgi:hypothetical protein